MQTNHPTNIESKLRTTANKIRSDIHNLQCEYDITYKEYSRRRGIENILAGIAFVIVMCIAIAAGLGLIVVA